jgi:hypothetical protein
MQLQQPPVGLIGLLNLKTTGKNPDEFSEQITAVLDAVQPYGMRTRVTLGVSGTATAPGVVAEIAASQGQCLIINALSISAARDVADVALTITPFVRLFRERAGLSTVVLVSPMPPPVSTDLSQHGGLWLPRPIWLADGDSLQLYTESTTSQLCTYTMQVDCSHFTS